jgi:aspartyl/asparaginyl beta-hydroxylase (cupin superfamily)
VSAVAPALGEVDRLVHAGDLPAAAARLEALVESDGGEVQPAIWLRLAALRRALRQPRRALDAVHAALAQTPFDFPALAMRAGLLERLDPAKAGEAWSEALAQRPAGALPPPMAAAVAEGERLRDAWLAERDARITAATAPFAELADEDTAWRIARFRDNVLRRARVYHSEPTHFAYPGLVEREFHPRMRFPWLAELEAKTDLIRTEMRAVIENRDAELVPYVDYAPHEAMEQWRPLNRNRDWTAAHLVQQGIAVEANAALCPETMAALQRIPQPRIAGAGPNAMFSLLAPHTAIPPHVGVNNARLVCHLPLVVPEGCWFRVGAETRHWTEGEAFVFDDTIEHEALNPSDRLRVVLIFDVWHPDLTPCEQDAIAAAIASEGTATDGGL